MQRRDDMRVRGPGMFDSQIFEDQRRSEENCLWVVAFFFNLSLVLADTNCVK